MGQLMTRLKDWDIPHRALPAPLFLSFALPANQIRPGNNLTLCYPPTNASLIPSTAMRSLYYTSKRFTSLAVNKLLSRNMLVLLLRSIGTLIRFKGSGEHLFREAIRTRGLKVTRPSRFRLIERDRERPDRGVSAEPPPLDNFHEKMSSAGTVFVPYALDRRSTTRTTTRRDLALIGRYRASSSSTLTS